MSNVSRTSFVERPQVIHQLNNPGSSSYHNQQPSEAQGSFTTFMYSEKSTVAEMFICMLLRYYVIKKKMLFLSDNIPLTIFHKVIQL